MGGIVACSGTDHMDEGKNLKTFEGNRRLCMLMIEKKKQVRMAIERLSEDRFSSLYDLFEKELDNFAKAYYDALKHEVGDGAYIDEDLKVVLDFVHSLQERRSSWLFLEFAKWLKDCKGDWKATYEILGNERLVKQLKDADDDKQRRVGLIPWSKPKPNV